MRCRPRPTNSGSRILRRGSPYRACAAGGIARPAIAPSALQTGRSMRRALAANLEPRSRAISGVFAEGLPCRVVPRRRLDDLAAADRRGPLRANERGTPRAEHGSGTERRNSRRRSGQRLADLVTHELVLSASPSRPNWCEHSPGAPPPLLARKRRPGSKPAPRRPTRSGDERRLSGPAGDAVGSRPRSR